MWPTLGAGELQTLIQAGARLRSAHLRVYRDPALARSFLWPLIQEPDAHCVGSLSEIFDGDPPHTPRGCIAQEWTVAEVLRVWLEPEEG